ncbi:hypothetical protein PGB90_004034 [Kerria lacca]
MCSCSKLKLLAASKVANALEPIERQYRVHPFNEKHEEEEERFLQFYTSICQYSKKFFEYYRMSVNLFDELLKLIRAGITKMNTFMRNGICTEERLIITLRMVYNLRSSLKMQSKEQTLNLIRINDKTSQKLKCICEKEFISKRTLFKHTMQFHHKVVKNEEVCSKLTTKSHSEDVPEISEQKNIIEKIPYNSHQLIEKIADNRTKNNSSKKQIKFTDSIKEITSNDLPCLSQKYKCLKCAIKFSKEQNLLEHQKIYHNMIVKIKEIDTNKTIMNDVLKHYNVICAECNAKFISKISLIRHIRRLHTVNMRKNNQNSKEILESNVKECNYRSELVDISLIPQNSKKTIKCMYCTKMFFRINGLSKHLKKFHPNLNRFHLQSRKTVQCSICSKMFSRKHTLKRHVIKFHPENIDPNLNQV